MAELGHDRLDLLKVDVEGAEQEVIRSMLASGIRPTVLCMEFDQPAPWQRIATTVRRIRKAGFRLVSVAGWNFTFVQEQALLKSEERRVGKEWVRRLKFWWARDD